MAIFCLMDLKTYLDERSESVARFAVRVGRHRYVAPATIAAVRAGRTSPNMTTAQAIVQASEDEPAPDGGTVTYEDLAPDSVESGGEAA